MRRGPHGLDLHRRVPASEISCGAFLPNARPLRGTLRHRVAVAQGVARLGGAHQLAVLEPEHHAGPDWNTLAESALVRGFGDDAVTLDCDDTNRHRLVIRPSHRPTRGVRRGGELRLYRVSTGLIRRPQ